MTLEEKFAKIVKEDLPSKIGDELKEVLIKAEQDAKDLEHAKKANKEACLKIQNLEKAISKYKNMFDGHKELDIRDEELTERERNLKISLLEIKLEEAYNRAGIIKDLALGLVKNNIVRKTIFDSENKNVPFSDGNGYTGSTIVNNTRSITEEKTED